MAGILGKLKLIAAAELLPAAALDPAEATATPGVAVVGDFASPTGRAEAAAATAACFWLRGKIKAGAGCKIQPTKNIQSKDERNEHHLSLENRSQEL